MDLKLSGLLADSLAACHPVKCKTKKKPIKLPFPRSSHMPAAWERTSAVIKATYATIILAQKPGAYSLSLRIGKAKIDAIKHLPRGPVDALRREIMRSTKRVLGHPLEFWLHPDLGQSGPHANLIGSLHLHGAITIDPDELDQVKVCLLDVAGDYYRPRALNLAPVKKPLSVFAGPGDHSARNVRQVMGVVKGELFTATRDLNSRARCLYNEHRSAYIKLKEMQG